MKQVKWVEEYVPLNKKDDRYVLDGIKHLFSDDYEDDLCKRKKRYRESKAAFKKMADRALKQLLEEGGAD